MQSKKVVGNLALGSKVVVAWMEKWEGVSFIFLGWGGGGYGEDERRFFGVAGWNRYVRKGCSEVIAVGTRGGCHITIQGLFWHA